MAPYAHNATLSLPTKLVSIAYPLMDVLLLGMLLRLLVGSGRRTVGLTLLSVGFVATLVTDSIYGWKLLHGGDQTGGLLDLGWAGFYALLGAATLHLSTRTLFATTAARKARLTGRRIVLLAAASVTVPVVMFMRSLLGGALDIVPDMEVLAVAAALLFALVLLRMTGLLHSNERAVRREAERSAELAVAERSAKSKDAFVSQVSHELRTPLTSIRGYAELLGGHQADEPSPAERDTFLAVITRNADRLLGLVEDLLFLAQVDDDQLAPRRGRTRPRRAHRRRGRNGPAARPGAPDHAAGRQRAAVHPARRSRPPRAGRGQPALQRAQVHTRRRRGHRGRSTLERQRQARSRGHRDRHAPRRGRPPVRTLLPH
jgi:signal transduction histidine kinase